MIWELLGWVLVTCYALGCGFMGGIAGYLAAQWLTDERTEDG